MTHAARVRAAIFFWLVAGAIVWIGIFDLAMKRGTSDYLHREAVHELRRWPPLNLQESMAEKRRVAALTASGWALTICAAGLWTVFWMNRQSPRTSS